MKSTDHQDLGRFVCVRRGKNGDVRVLFVVPQRLRPNGWPPSIRLPELGPWRGDLGAPSHRDAILRDAKRLNGRLDESRRQARIRECGPGRTLIELVQIYLRSDQYRELGLSRKYRNKRSVNLILRWSESRQHPDIKDITRSQVEDFLSIYEDRPSTKYDMRSIWNVLFECAIAEQWCQRNPVAKRNWYIRRATAVQLWTEADVQIYARAASQLGQPALGAMLIAMLRVGQRAGDMREARWGVNYNGERIIFRQSKKRAKVNIPIPVDLQKLLAEVRVPGSDFVFTDAVTGKGFSPGSLTARFAEVRLAAVSQGAPPLQVQTLRHSAVCALMSAGVPIMEIASITGHLLPRVHVILERYAPDREGMAERGMKKAHRARGGVDADFGSAGFSDLADWDGEGRPPAYTLPSRLKNRPSRIAFALYAAGSAPIDPFAHTPA